RVRALLRDGIPPDEPSAGSEAARRAAAWDDDLRQLAEEARRRRARRGEAVLPAHLSVTALVELQRDPESLARSLLRPMPRRPSPVTRRGTAFHAWLERSVFGAPQLLDPLELPGSADADRTDVGLAALQEAFRRSPWWRRRPYEIEVPFEMDVEGLLVRGRMDAVFVEQVYDAGAHGQLDLLSASPDTVRVDVVDWKTGRRPAGPDAQAAAVQLAAYRLAWHQLSGVPLEQIGAAFHYVADGETVRPADLLDAEGLRALVRGVPVRGVPVRPDAGATGAIS
ncbi:MAG TPA: PD-(D/E)XK nuclease family protein, partial [Mycobacteriales bacterium]|nr:PD-(D/E)XK nuclease family protein [Mycobacteriales bacterium]